MRIKTTTAYFGTSLVMLALFGAWIAYLNYIDFFKIAFQDSAR